MGKNGYNADTPLDRIVHVLFWLGVGVICIGIIIGGALAVISAAIVALSRASLTEAVIIGLGMIVLTVGYWGLVSRSEKSGLAHWHRDEREEIEADLDEWDEEGDRENR